MTALIAGLHAAFHEPSTRVYRVVQGVVWALIVLSIGILLVEALLPAEIIAETILNQLDRAILAVFAAEILLRVATFRPPALRPRHEC